MSNVFALRPERPGCPDWCADHREYPGVLGVERSVEHRYPIAKIDAPDGRHLDVRIEAYDHFDERGRCRRFPGQLIVDVEYTFDLILTSASALALALALQAAAEVVVRVLGEES